MFGRRSPSVHPWYYTDWAPLVTGTIELADYALTIDEQAQVTARISARIVTIRGSVTESVTAREIVDIRDTGSLDGDVIAPRIVLADSGYFRGTVNERPVGTDHTIVFALGLLVVVSSSAILESYDHAAATALGLSADSTGQSTRANLRRANQIQGGLMPGYSDAERCATTSRWSLLNVIREQS